MRKDLRDGPRIPWLALVTLLAFVLGFSGRVLAEEPQRTIQVGSEIGFYPFVDLDASGKPTGFAVELFAAVAKAEGIPVRFEPDLWDTVWGRLKNGQIDALPLVARNPQREGQVEFTRPHTLAYDAFFVPEDRPPVASIDQARALKIIVVRSDAAHNALVARGFEDQLVLVDNMADAFRLLATGHYDAVLAPFIQGRLQLAQLGLSDLIEAGPPLREYRREFTFAVRKGDVALRDRLDHGLATVKASGEYDRLYRKWLGIHETSMFPVKYVLIGSGATLALFALLGAWTWTLRRQVARRTAELAQANASLEQRVAERTANLEKARREAEEARDILRVTMDNVPALMSYIDANGHYRRVNKNYEPWFGRAEAELVGRPAAEILGEPTWQTIRPAVERVLSGEPVSYEFQLPRPDGTLRWLSGTYSPDIDRAGVVRGFVAHVLDITERKRAELALRESEARFRATADSAPVLIWMSGTNKLCTWVNQQWLAFTGQTMEQTTGHGWETSLHPEDVQRCLDIYEQSFEKCERFQMEYRLRRADGEYRWVVDEGVPRYGPDGEFLGYIGSCVDITLRKRAEEALREADQRKDQFLAMLAHELRNPLTPIRNAAQLLALPGLDEGRVKWAAEIIASQVRHLVRLVDDLLDISRITRGRVELRQEIVDVAYIVAKAVETTRPLIESKNHCLKISLPDSNALLNGDPVRLVQVLVNLLDNAAKYTPPGGNIELNVRLAGGEIELSVRDDGLGIPPDLLAHVFDLFEQGERTLDRSQGGLGIGLSLVERLVSLHGGRVVAQSPGRGAGSLFTVWLPAATSTRIVEAPAPKPVSLRPMRVLVVDDQEDVALSMAAMLEMQGHQVRTALNGYDALREAGEFRPDAVLLDIGLPVMDGYEIARRLRALPHGKRLRIIAISGYGDATARARGREAGFDAHLIKPVDFDQIEMELAAAQDAGTSFDSPAEPDAVAQAAQ